MTLFEETDTDGFMEILTKTLGIDEDAVSEMIENLDVDELTDLCDACMKGNTDLIKKIASGKINKKDDADDQSDDEPEIGDLLAPKEKLQKKAKAAQHQKEEDVEEDADPPRAFGHGDDVRVSGADATVKIPSAAGDTVGVLINGELKMVDKKTVKPVAEGVLGMTSMPGLKPTPEGDNEIKRIRELAGLPAQTDMAMEPEPALPPADPALDAPVEAPPMDAMDAPDTPVPPAPGPMDDISVAEPVEADDMALDHAISEIEAAIPNTKISDYKKLVARLKGLVTAAEAAGKAALTESTRALKVEDKVVAKSKPETAPKVEPPKEFKADKEVTGRKTLMDYVAEAEEGHETLGFSRADAAKAIQSRMGAGTTPQDANKALDALIKDGGVRQVGSSFTMMPTDDNTLKSNLSAVANTAADAVRKNNMNKPTANNQNSAAKTVNPGANIQGAPNSRYQGG
jgi:hypothetical protein